MTTHDYFWNFLICQRFADHSQIVLACKSSIVAPAALPHEIYDKQEREQFCLQAIICLPSSCLPPLLCCMVFTYLIIPLAPPRSHSRSDLRSCIVCTLQTSKRQQWKAHRCSLEATCTVYTWERRYKVHKQHNSRIGMGSVLVSFILVFSLT